MDVNSSKNFQSKIIFIPQVFKAPSQSLGLRVFPTYVLYNSSGQGRVRKAFWNIHLFIFSPAITLNWIVL